MSAWARVPLRLRVALAFALSTAVALVALGVFLHLRVADTLEDQTSASLETRSDALLQLSPSERAAAIRDLSGESFGQVLASDGRVLAASPQLRDPLLDPGQVPRVGASSTLASSVYLEAEGESGPAALRVVRPDSEVVVVGVPTEDVTEVLEGLRTQLVLGGGLTLLLASLLGYAIAGAALRPIERMRARAATISANSPGERLPLPDVRDEVHRLGHTLNDMLGRLDDALGRQRQFVAEASHELRTPLALLRTELDLAASRPRSVAENAAFLASATEEVDRLGLLVDQLMLLAQADEGRLALDLAPLDARDLLARVVRRFARAEAGRSVVLEPGEPVEVLADAARLDQAVSNLVDNALRHGRGVVTVGAADDGDRVRITVADEGTAPIAEEMFDRFRRGEGSRAGGRGLGLSLVRAIVSEHDGAVRVGGAATVTLELPARPAQPVG